MKLSGLIIETSPVHSTKSARPLSIVKFVFLCDNVEKLRVAGGLKYARSRRWEKWKEGRLLLFWLCKFG